MAVNRDRVMQELEQVAVPGGSNLVRADLIRALTMTEDEVSFVIEASDAALARALETASAEAESRLRALGFSRVRIVTTAPAGKQPGVAARSGPAAGAGAPPTSGHRQASSSRACRRCRGSRSVGSSRGGRGCCNR